MAIAIQRMWSLAVLRASLLTDREFPRVRLQFVVNSDGKSRDEGPALEFPLGELGDVDGLLQGRIYDTALRLPQTAVDWVSDWVISKRETDPSRFAVLWLHLLKPYGYLGGVAWEEQLGPSLGTPVLRLPDVLPRPIESHVTLNIVLCASNAIPGAHETIQDALLSTAAAIGQAHIPRKVTLHVFADAGLLDTARQVEDVAEGMRIHVHDPHERATLPPDASGVYLDIRNPWYSWIHEELGSSSIGAMHLVAHGSMAMGNGAILFTKSPSIAADGVHVSALDSAEINAAATRLGVWTLGFTSPAKNLSSIGLRLFADRCGATRAGSVLLHMLSPDADQGSQLADLASVYRLLYASDEPQPPRAADLMLYTQPERLAARDATPERENRTAIANSPEVWPEATKGFTLQRDPSEGTRQMIETSEEVPAWINVAQRYIDEREQELLQYQDVEATSALTSLQQAQYDGLQKGVAQAREILEKHAVEAFAEGEYS